MMVLPLFQYLAFWLLSNSSHPGPVPATAVARCWTEGGTSVVLLEIRNPFPNPTELKLSGLAIDYSAVLANSACKPHAIPRRVRAVVSDASAGAVVVVKEGKTQKDRCSERIRIASIQPKPVDGVVRLDQGASVTLRLEFFHDHFLYGEYDPLLGAREITVRWGPLVAMAKVLFPEQVSGRAATTVELEPSRGRQDPTFYTSAPGSLYLAADIPGYQYYRFDDVRVRYNSTWTLRFRYAIARGTRAACYVRVVEYQDAPRYWRRLGGGFDCELTEQGRWVTFERTFRVGPETTTLAVDFRVTGSDVGEMWVDDVELVPSPVRGGNP